MNIIEIYYSEHPVYMFNIDKARFKDLDALCINLLMWIIVCTLVLYFFVRVLYTL